jgi:hypothetical protein
MSEDDKLIFLKMTNENSPYNNTKIKKVIKDSNINTVQELADFTKANSYILTNKTQQSEFSRCL